MKTILLSGLILIFTSAGLLAQDDTKAIESALANHFQIYILQADRRSPEDRVVVKGNRTQGYQAEISYWNSLKSKDPTQEICNAYQWLLFGRGSAGRGAPDAFSKYPGLREVSLRFFDVEFTTKVGKKRAEILPAQRVIPYLRVSVTKTSLAAKKPNWNDVQTMIEKGQCAEVGNRYTDARWFDQDYLRQGQAKQ